MQMCAWAMGEYGDVNTAEIIAKHLQHDIATDLDGYLLLALVKLKTRGQNTQYIIDKLMASNYTLAQRVHECKYILSQDLKCLNYELPEGFESKTKFLYKIADRALECGAKPYSLPKKFEKPQEFVLPDVNRFYKKMENTTISLPDDAMAIEEKKAVQSVPIDSGKIVTNARWGPDGYKWSKTIVNTVGEKPEKQSTPILKASPAQVHSKEKEEEREKRAAALFSGLTLK